ncbi:MAG TPA: DNA polymerase I [Burkholderiales bacterium]|nr:DNA polymerase I [Burkholderiales bacterium]
MKTLLLVDGSSYLYRAYHALPDLRTTKGEPTGAIYGVLNMLRKLLKDVRADYSAVIFDAKGKTFRDDLYADYKANREAMPDELTFQVQALHDAIRAMGWPLIVVDGVEADDVIGTLTKEAEKAGNRVVISTGDKDMAQLVTPAVTLVNTMSNETLDETGVEKKFGVKPERFLDYLALIGDAIDNIPGVEKVGPKTACKWLMQYGTLEGVLAHAGEIGGVVGENLRKVADWLPKARELMTIKCDVELPVKASELELKPQDRQKLAQMFDRFEFKTWRRELEAGAEVAKVEVPPSAVPAGLTVRAEEACDYETVLTEEQLNAWVLRLEGAELAAIDTETTSIDPFRAELVGISLSVERACAAYIPVGHRYTGAPEQLPVELVLERLKPWLEDPARPKVGQNIKFDMHVFANYGVTLAGVQHDTLIQSYVLESHKSHDMDNLAERHLQLKTTTYDEMTGKGARRIPFEQVAVEQATEYGAEDADVTLRLHRAMCPEVDRDEKMCRIYREIEMPVMQVLFEMERNGVLIDMELLTGLSREFGGKMMDIERRSHEQAGQPFNINSPKQIQEILFDKHKLPVIKKTPSGTPSTDEDVLAQLALDHPLPKLILEYRSLSKLKSTYTDKLPEMVNPRTKRVHTCYSQAVAVTGRLSSSEPNLQNIPIRTAEGRRIREAFIAERGSCVMSADYSQVELRIMAHISRDENLLKAFSAGEDIHRATAAEVFGTTVPEVTAEQRRYVKAINFGLMYGMSAFGLSRQLEIERSAAAQYIDRYFTRYPGVKAYMEQTRESARERGYVETVFGRRLYLPDIKSGSPMRRQGAERAAINAPMQGTAADLIKLAMIRVQDWLRAERLGTKLVMQVHDELVLEVPEAEVDRVRAELPGLMSGVAQLAVPLVVEVGVGKNWDEAH